MNTIDNINEAAQTILNDPNKRQEMLASFHTNSQGDKGNLLAQLVWNRTDEYPTNEFPTKLKSGTSLGYEHGHHIPTVPPPSHIICIDNVRGKAGPGNVRVTPENCRQIAVEIQQTEQMLLIERSKDYTSDTVIAVGATPKLVQATRLTMDKLAEALSKDSENQDQKLIGQLTRKLRGYLGRLPKEYPVPQTIQTHLNQPKAFSNTEVFDALNQSADPTSSVKPNKQVSVEKTKVLSIQQASIKETKTPTVKDLIKLHEELKKNPTPSSNSPRKG